MFLKTLQPNICASEWIFLLESSVFSLEWENGMRSKRSMEGIGGTESTEAQRRKGTKAKSLEEEW